MASSPIRYFGGKGRMVAVFDEMMGTHRTFVDVFGGGGSVVLGKVPSTVDVYNDANEQLANMFSVIGSPDAYDEFYKLCVCTPYSRAIFQECKTGWKDEPDPVKRAWMYFTMAFMAFSGNLMSAQWSHSITNSSKGMSSSVSAYLSCLEEMPGLHDRLQRIQIENMDFGQLIEKYDAEDTLFYLDPPYVTSTRKSAKVYIHEMDDSQHVTLVEMLLSLRGKAILSGYAHELYLPLEAAGWAIRDYKVSCPSIAHTKSTGLKGAGVMREEHKRIERVWISPNCAVGRIPGFFPL